MIAAIDMNWAIGKNNQLLCHLPNDLRHFRKITENQVVVMGRKTYESMGKKPLKNRINIVITSQEDYDTEYYEDNYSTGVLVMNSVDDVLDYHDFITSTFAEPLEFFIIGGEQIYNEFIDCSDRIYLTMIYKRFEGADTFLPPLPLTEWKTVEVTPNYKNENNEYDHDFVVINRRFIDID